MKRTYSKPAIEIVMLKLGSQLLTLSQHEQEASTNNGSYTNDLSRRGDGFLDEE